MNAFGEERLRGNVAIGELDIVERHVHTATGELKGDCTTESGGASRHDCGIPTNFPTGGSSCLRPLRYARPGGSLFTGGDLRDRVVGNREITL